MHKVRCALLTAALVGLGTLPAVSLAQARDLPAPRQVKVRIAPSGVRAPDSLSADRYLLDVRAPRRAPAMLQLIKPDRGYSRADLRADERRGGQAAYRRILANIRFFGGSEVRAGGTGALWETLYAGRYWLMGARPGGLSIKTLRVHGTPSLSSFPRVSAQATGTEKGLRLTRRTTATGRMLIRNMSRRLDELILFPLRRGTTYADFLHWMHHPNGDMPVLFWRARSTAILSRDAGYVLRYRLHPGDYVVLSLSSLKAASGPNALRELFRPLTVRRRAGANSGRTAVTRGAEGFEKAPAAARRVERWLTDGDRAQRKLAEELAVGSVRRFLTR